MFQYANKQVNVVVGGNRGGYVYDINNSGTTIGGGYTNFIGSSPIADSFIPASINNSGQVDGTHGPYYIMGVHAGVRTGNYSPTNEIDLGVGYIPNAGSYGSWNQRTISTPIGLDPFNFFVVGETADNSFISDSVPSLWYEGTPSSTNGSGVVIPGKIACNSLNDLLGQSSTNWIITAAVAVNDPGCIAAIATKTSDGSGHVVLLVPDRITRDGNPINASNNTVCKRPAWCHLTDGTCGLV